MNIKQYLDLYLDDKLSIVKYIILKYYFDLTFKYKRSILFSPDGAIFRWWSHLHMRLCVYLFVYLYICGIKKLVSRLRPEITKPMPRQIYYRVVVGHRRN